MLAFIFLSFMFILIAAAAILLFKYFKKNIDKEDEKDAFIPTTQDNIPIDYVRDGIIKMKNGSYASVINVPSINIDLMEAEEKHVIFEQYREILSAIGFPFQFLQQSRIVDVSDYLKKLEKIKLTTTNEFASYQLNFYQQYIVDLVSTSAVLTKKFYIIVSFDEEVEKRKKAKGGASKFDLSLNKKKEKNKKNQETENVIDEEKKFDFARKQLQGRAGMVKRLFSRFEITPEILHDDEIIELFYTSYNKSRSVYQSLGTKINENYSSLYVKKGRGK